MRKISAIKRGEIEGVKKYLVKQYRWGKNPPSSIEEWQKGWFRHHSYPEVYQIVHTASILLAEESGGRIQFRHNFFQDIWRFHEGINDYLTLFYGSQQRIAGHIHTQDVDFGYGKVLIPKIEKEIVIIDTPLLQVGKKRALTLKQKYIASEK